MNCEDFNEIINELADYKPLDVTTRDAGVSHVALCADCAAKLANARAVSCTLLLAASAESEDAPVKIKENLLAAFAAQQQTAPAPDNVVPISSRRKLGWWTAAAVAAAAAIVFAVMVPVWRGAPVTRQQPSFAYTPTFEAPTKPSIATEKPVPTGTDQPSNTPSVGSRRQRREKLRRVITSTTSESVARTTANEYIPLTYLATATAMDTGTIVRVQLSRSALVRLGLPINIESSNESVRAEVVIGDDGVARAIRLVQ